MESDLLWSRASHEIRMKWRLLGGKVATTGSRGGSHGDTVNSGSDEDGATPFDDNDKRMDNDDGRSESR